MEKVKIRPGNIVSLSFGNGNKYKAVKTCGSQTYAIPLDESLVNKFAMRFDDGSVLISTKSIAKIHKQ